MPRSLFADVCWPSRYLLRWLTVFFASLVAGVVLAVLFGPREVQATVQVRVVYSDVRAGVPVGAILYQDARTLGEKNPRKSFFVPPEGSRKTLTSGQRAFVIQPVERKRNARGGFDYVALGDPEPVRQPWPRKEGEIVQFRIVRSYPKNTETRRPYNP